MTNCHVSLKPNKGPVIAQTSTTTTAKIKVDGLPEIREVATASRANNHFLAAMLQTYLLSEGLRALEPAFEMKTVGGYLGSIRSLGSEGSTFAPAAASLSSVVTPSCLYAGLDLSIINTANALARTATALAISKDLKCLSSGMATSLSMQYR
jgi:hypothetical protein